MEECKGETGNKKFVEVFGHNRFRYATSSNDVILDCALQCDIMRLLIHVSDPWVISRKYGMKQRMSFVPDNVVSRRALYFFEVGGHPFATFEECFP